MTLLDYFWFIGVPLIFVLIAIYVLRPRARKRYREYGEIPFKEDNRTRRKKRH